MVRQLRIPKARQKALLGIIREKSSRASVAPEPDVQAAALSSVQEKVTSSVHSLLTLEEMRIFQLIIEGYRNTEIAARLKIPQEVVKKRLRTMLSHELEREAARIRSLLTSDEMRMTELIMLGRRNSEIAAHFGSSEEVVKQRLRTIYQKVGVGDRLELALLMLRNGVVKPASAEANPKLEGEVLQRVDVAS